MMKIKTFMLAACSLSCVFSNQVQAQIFASGNTLSGGTASAIGTSNSVSSYNALAVGALNTVGGSVAFAAGQINTANGDAGFAAGQLNSANGNTSLALGFSNQALQTNSIAIGKYTKSDATNAVVIGLGTGSSTRLTNATSNSLMVGFNSTAATLFVGPSSGGSTTGAIGIGTTTINPGTKLQVAGKVTIENTLDMNSTKIINLQNPTANQDAVTKAYADTALAKRATVNSLTAGLLPKWSGTDLVNSSLYSGNTGNVGIGTTSPRTKLDVNGAVTIGSTQYTGTATTQTVMLSVDGAMVGKEVLVTQVNWADYVFDDNYRLTSLDEVESFIKSNKHLPGVPSQKEIEQRGAIDLGSTSVIQQEKIEELYMHIIALHKQVKALAAQNEKLLLDSNAGK